MTTWNNGRVHDLLEPGSPQERLGTRLNITAKIDIYSQLTPQS